MRDHSFKKQHSPPWLQPVPAATADKRALIIGAGLAGAASARALAQRGWQVTVIDRHSRPAQGASGNRRGILYVRLSAHTSPLLSLVVNGYRYTLKLLEQLPHTVYDLCGIAVLPSCQEEQMRQQQQARCGLHDAYVEYSSCRQLQVHTGLNFGRAGLYFPDGGWVDPKELVAWQLNHPSIVFAGNQSVAGLEYRRNEWYALAHNGKQWSAPVMIIAGGYEASTFAQTAHLPLKSIRGQTTEIPATQASMALKSVACGKGYITPAYNGVHTIGATFHFDDPEPQCRAHDHLANIKTIGQLAPALAEDLALDRLDHHSMAGRVGFRCTTPDYLPVVGPVLDSPLFQQRFNALKKNRLSRIDAAVPWHTGLYINTGHGSRGLITAPLSGELVASHITGESTDLHISLMEALHPARFPARTLIKNRAAVCTV